MTTAMFAIWLAARGAGSAIGSHGVGVIVRRVDRARSQVFIDDSLQECACAHRANFEEANLFAAQSHLRDGVVNDHAQLGMETNLKRISAHEHCTVELNGRCRAWANGPLDTAVNALGIGSYCALIRL